MYKASFQVVVSSLLLSAAVCGAALAAQDRSKLAAPDGGLKFSEFKGYEDWAPVAPSQVPDGIKVIAANPVMIKAYKKGLPLAGRKFPDGSKIVKIEWSPVPNTVSPYPVNVPGRLMTVSFIVKDLKRFPKSNGWAYAQFAANPKTGELTPNGSGNQCGYACHTKVAAQDYIFTAYPKR